MTRISFRFALLSLTCLGGVIASATASATEVGEEGCTPGYWKNHTESWLGADGAVAYEPTDAFSDVFGVRAGATTLLQALQGGGGSGIAGAQKILARAAVAAILNDAHGEVLYPIVTDHETENGDGIIAQVQSVWNSGDRQAILDLATVLDGYNNLGCPL